MLTTALLFILYLLKPFGKATYWCAASIQRILTNKATIGEYQPKTKVDGKQVASGEPIVNHYPPIISHEQYTAVQLARESRRVGLRGRKGKRFSNLLTGIAKCARCGSNLRYVSQQSPEHAYLCCSQSRDNSGRCPHIGLRYRLVEKAVLASLTELDWQSLIANSAPDHKLQRVTLQARLTVIEDHLLTSQKRTANLIDAIADGGPSPKALVAAADKSEQETNRLTKELNEAQEALKAHTRTAEIATETAAAFTSAVDLLDSVTSAPDVYALRAKVHHLMSQLISEMYCSKWTPSDEVQRHLLSMTPDNLQDLFKLSGVKSGGIILVRYRLKEDTLQLKARLLLINVFTGDTASFTEQVPEGIQQRVVTESPVIDPSMLPVKAHGLPWQQQLAYLTEEQQHVIMDVYDSETFYGSGNPSKWTRYDGIKGA